MNLTHRNRVRKLLQVFAIIFRYGLICLQISSPAERAHYGCIFMENLTRRMRETSLPRRGRWREATDEVTVRMLFHVL